MEQCFLLKPSILHSKLPTITSGLHLTRSNYSTAQRKVTSRVSFRALRESRLTLRESRRALRDSRSTRVTEAAILA